MLEVSLLGAGTVLRLERDAWSTVKSRRQAKDEYHMYSPFVRSVSNKNKSLAECVCHSDKFMQIYLDFLANMDGVSLDISLVPHSQFWAVVSTTNCHISVETLPPSLEGCRSPFMRLAEHLPALCGSCNQ